MAAGRVGVVVADVCDHGLGPALVMSQTRAYLHALLPLGLGVSELATRLNDFLVSDDAESRFVTFFLAQLNPDDGTMVYASAGHQCFLIGPGDEVQPLNATSLPLGVLPGCVPSSQPQPLQPGQITLFLTDGVAETESPRGEAYGIERTLDVVRANRHRPAGEIVETLYRAARDFAQNRPQLDDITAVILKIETT
jgi:serine phosphatase RsbU (regulator of sigma subunit)